MERYRLDPDKLRQLTPEEERRLAKARIDYSDIPPLGDEFFAQAKRAWPPTKQQLTVRLDTDVLAWLKQYGRATRLASIGFCGQPWKAKVLAAPRRRIRPRRRRAARPVYDSSPNPSGACKNQAHRAKSRRKRIPSNRRAGWNRA